MKKKLLCLLCFASFHAYTQVCFYPHTQYAVGTNTNTKAITSGDFNNDNKPDLAVAIVSPSMVSILLGSGTGSFTVSSSYTIANTQPYAIVSADFNNDNKADVAVANNGSALQGFTVLLGNGAGAFTTAYSYTTTGTNPAGIATGDFNGDNKKDIAITNYNSTPGTVSVYFGNGNGTFGTATTYTVGTSPEGIVCADVTGDGKVDLVIANSGSNNVTVLWNTTGAGIFSVLGTFSTGSSTAPKELVAVDLNGDNHLDLVTCNNSSANISVLLNNGSGQYSSANTYNAGTSPLGITTADFDGDGNADVAVANSSGNNVSVLRGDGAGGFYTPPINFSTAKTPVKLVSADFNVDGKPDIATADENVASDSVSVLLNSLPGPINVSGPTTTVCAGTANTLTASGAENYLWNTSLTTTSITVNPTTNTSYTVTGTNTSCTVTATGSFSVNTTPLPNVTANASPSSTVCAGTTVTLSGGGASSYSWSGGVINGVGFIPTSSSLTYTVIGTDANTCSNTATKTIIVHQLPNVTANASPSSTVCAGTTVTLSGGGASSYSWSGGVINGVGFVPTSSSLTYTVIGTDANTCSNTATKTITVDPLPVVTASVIPSSTVCAGTTITLSGGGASSYSWSGGVTDGIGFIPTSNATYTVTGTDANSCSNTDTENIYVLTPPVPAICTITVDSLSNYNVIVWDKSSFTNVDSFFIYRDTANNNFALIGSVPYDSLSQFTDTLRSLYAANGDPNASTWKYKLAAKDTCGNVSAMSPYHKTLFIQNNSGNFSWNDYQIEGQIVPVPALQNYLFQRDNNSNGNWVTIQTLSASSLSYTDAQYATYQSTATWRVVTKWTISCTPTIVNPKNPFSMATTVNNSKSNHFRTSATTSVNTISLENLVSVFPNPSNGEFTIEMGNGKLSFASYHLSIYDVYGKKVFEQTINRKQETIDLREVPNGIYFAHIQTARETLVKKIIVGN